MISGPHNIELSCAAVSDLAKPPDRPSDRPPTNQHALQASASTICYEHPASLSPRSLPIPSPVSATRPSHGGRGRVALPPRSVSKPTALTDATFRTCTARPIKLTHPAESLAKRSIRSFARGACRSATGGCYSTTAEFSTHSVPATSSVPGVQNPSASPPSLRMRECTPCPVQPPRAITFDSFPLTRYRRHPRCQGYRTHPPHLYHYE